MHDTLDLKQLAKQANRQKLWGRFSTFMMFLVLIAIITGVFLTSNAPPQLYVRNESEWQGVSGYTGGTQYVHTSSDGNTWLLTVSPMAVNRWTGIQWEKYSNPILENPACICGMTSDEENNIWVATEKGIFQFDGEKWTDYPEAIKNEPASIAASSLGVYVIDATGNLSHFDGHIWTIDNIRNVLPSLKSKTDDRYPSLVAALDGSIMLRWQGIWHYDGNDWQEITIDDTQLDRIGLIGTAHNRLWTQWADGLVVSRLDGSRWKSFDLHEMGLSSEGNVYEVAEFGDSYLFQTNEGLIEYDGKTWTKLPLPNGENTPIEEISVNPDGHVWVIVDRSASIVSQIIGFLALSLVVIIFFITLIVNASRNTVGLRKARQLLAPLIPATTTSPKVRNANWALIAIIILFIVQIVVALAGRIDLVDIMTPFILLLLCIWIARRTLQSAGTFRERVSKNLSYLWMLLWLVGLWFGMKWLSVVNQPLVGIFFVIMIALGFIPNGLNILRYIKRYAGENAYQNLSTDNTKNNLSGTKLVNFQFLRGSAALLAGHMEEAETLTRECVAQGQFSNSTILAGSLNTLGLALAYQKRTEEAIKYIEIAIQINPTLTSIVTSLAEVYLEAGTDDERALEVIEFARRYGQESWLVRLLKQSSRPITEGVSAWVLARLGRFEEADRRIQFAIRGIPPKKKPETAYMYFIKGKIEDAKGNPEQSKEWLTRANQIDSGLYGQLAAKALKELPASS